MKKIAQKRVLTRARAKTRKYSIVSFSIDDEALAAFNRACRKHGVKRSVVVEAFMKEFAEING